MSVTTIEALALKALKSHFQMKEDNWYSCPKSGMCVNEDAEYECRFGAEESNAEVLKMVVDGGWDDVANRLKVKIAELEAPQEKLLY